MTTTRRPGQLWLTNCGTAYLLLKIYAGLETNNENVWGVYLLPSWNLDNRIGNQHVRLWPEKYLNDDTLLLDVEN